MDVKSRAGEIKEAFVVPITGFNPGIVFGIDRDVDGRLYIAFKSNDFSTPGTIDVVIVVRLDGANTLDPTFGKNGLVKIGFNDPALEAGLNGLAMVRQADGGVLVVVKDAIENFNRAGLARLKNDGSLDDTFGNGGIIVHSFFESMSDNYPFVTTKSSVSNSLSQGRNNGGSAITLASGKFLYTSTTSHLRPGDGVVARFLSTGSLDEGFGDGGVVRVIPPSYDGHFTFLYGAIELADGKVVVCGNVGRFDGSQMVLNPKALVVRFNEDGTYDRSFGDGGFVLTDYPDDPDGKGVRFFRLMSIVSGQNGSLVCSGESSTIAEGVRTDTGIVHKLKTTGLPDSSFNNGRVIVFGTPAQTRAFRMAGLQADGKLVAAGYAQLMPVEPVSVEFLVARFNADGALDVSFARQGWTTAAIKPGINLGEALLLEADAIVVAGRHRSPSEPDELVVISFFA